MERAFSFPVLGIGLSYYLAGKSFESLNPILIDSIISRSPPLLLLRPYRKKTVFQQNGRADGFNMEQWGLCER